MDIVSAENKEIPTGGDDNQVDKSRLARQYEREKLALQIITELSSIVFLLVVVRLADFCVEWLSEVGLRGLFLLVVFGAGLYVLYQVCLFPLDYLSEYRLERIYGLGRENFYRWFCRHLKAIGVSGIILLIICVGFYLLLWKTAYWYVWSWLLLILFIIALSYIFPVVVLPIFYPARPLEDENMLSRFRELAKKVGLDVEGIYTLELSCSTSKANAMLAGLGKTRRVLLSDTLIENLTPQELDVVFAHELGHHRYRHFAKIIAINAIATFILLGFLYLLLKDVGGRSSYIAVVESIKRLPLLALTVSFYSLITRPIIYAMYRYFETESDRFALELIRDPKAFVSAFKKISLQNLSDPNPPRWVVWLYYDHPPIGSRIYLAEKLS